MRGVLHADVQSRERPGETVDGIRDDAMAEYFVFFDAAVGVDEDVIDLRLEALQYVRDHGFGAEKLQALVDAAHA